MTVISRLAWWESEDLLEATPARAQIGVLVPQDMLLLREEVSLNLHPCVEAMSCWESVHWGVLLEARPAGAEMRALVPQGVLPLWEEVVLNLHLCVGVLSWQESVNWTVLLQAAPAGAQMGALVPQDMLLLWKEVGVNPHLWVEAMMLCGTTGLGPACPGTIRHQRRHPDHLEYCSVKQEHTS